MCYFERNPSAEKHFYISLEKNGIISPTAETFLYEEAAFFRSRWQNCLPKMSLQCCFMQILVSGKTLRDKLSECEMRFWNVCTAQTRSLLTKQDAAAHSEKLRQHLTFLEKDGYNS